MEEEMVGRADVAVFDSLPVDLLQRIAAMVPYTTDTATRRWATFISYPHLPRVNISYYCRIIVSSLISNLQSYFTMACLRNVAENTRLCVRAGQSTACI